MGRRERYVIPPRMLKRYLEDQILPPPRHLKAPPGLFKLRNVPPRIRRLQWQQQQQTRWTERQILPPVDQFYYRRCCCSEFLPLQPALVGRSVLLQQWVLPEQRTVMLKEEEKKIEKEEEKILEEEMSTVKLDYSRLTSFLEKDESFLTPWSWKPEENKRQSRTDSYFSFNVRERWAVEKEIEPIST
ncbi:hypothetical protein OWV82_012212 [Melia azedarach]|uniref:Uncharacterized protein n=1 Tax=Melia azedarach TaxID=155640 RepID=A0ACC1Y0S0_MELAZ|nr:hypothetical protein OWV82_012212 [Melia azedarach]